MIESFLQDNGARYLKAGDEHLGKLVGYDHATRHITAQLGQEVICYHREEKTLGRPSAYVDQETALLLILRGKSDYAQAFQAWIVGVVIPAIAADGGYQVKEYGSSSDRTTVDKLFSPLGLGISKSE